MNRDCGLLEMAPEMVDLRMIDEELDIMAARLERRTQGDHLTLGPGRTEVVYYAENLQAAVAFSLTGSTGVLMSLAQD